MASSPDPTSKFQGKSSKPKLDLESPQLEAKSWPPWHHGLNFLYPGSAIPYYRGPSHEHLWIFRIICGFSFPPPPWPPVLILHARGEFGHRQVRLEFSAWPQVDGKASGISRAPSGRLRAWTGPTEPEPNFVLSRFGWVSVGSRLWELVVIRRNLCWGYWPPPRIQVKETTRMSFFFASLPLKD